MLHSGIIALLACCLVPGLDASEATSTAMTKRGNVRFGPSTDAPVVCTLDAGTQVEVMGPAPGRSGWYLIRFPRQGHAWMHTKVLAPTADPQVFTVTTDRARVRADARNSAEMVDELMTGETVEWVGSEIDGEWRGRKVADWYAVYPPGAVAYVHTSVLGLAPAEREEIQQAEVRGNQYEQLWQDARQRYEEYRNHLAATPQSALDLDWHGLATDLATVVEEHPTFRTRLMAKKLYAGIQKLTVAIQRTRQQQGLPPVGVLPDVPDPAQPAVSRPVAVQPAPQARPAAPPSQAATPPRQPTPQPSQPQAQQPNPPQPSQPVQPAPQPAPEPLPDLPDAPVGEVASGWLVQRDVPAVGAQHALIDEQNEVSALLVVDRAQPVQLSEFFWRRVDVSGPQQLQSVDLDGVSRQVPVITVTDVKLVK